MNNPHGGKLINRFFKKSELDLDNVDLVIQIDSDQVNEVLNIANGVYSPLEGFLNKDDFDSVLTNMKLANGIEWSIPLVLTISESQKKKLGKGSQILLQTPDKIDLSVLIVEDIYTFRKDDYAKNVYSTEDVKHPGVSMINSWGEYAIGGKLYVFGDVTKNYPDHNMTPTQTREMFQKNKWKTIVGFQTRNPAHMAHEFIQKLCLEFVDGLFVNPIIGKKKSGDFKDDVILSVYKMLIDQFYPKNSTTLGVYNSRMYYAGPKEAIFHAIVRKNFGCTHFIVGRDHAGVGDYYGKFAAHEIFDQLPNIGIQIMKVSNAFYDRRLKMFATQKTSPFNEIYRVSPSGTQVRKFIKAKNYEALRQVMRDEVLDIIFDFEEPFVE